MQPAVIKFCIRRDQKAAPFAWPVAHGQEQVALLLVGLGVGGDPARGERAADESRDGLYELLRGTEMVFVTARNVRVFTEDYSI